MALGFHPVVADWFQRRFGTPTEPQALGWPEIQSGRDTLISAPTGSGKTLAAFLACIDRLVRQGLEGQLKDETEILYVSPLKALGNDIEQNLREPLAELREAARSHGIPFPELRVAVRSGDTPAARRQTLLRHPPHILVTTPESLYLLLTTERGRSRLAAVRTVIVDEIHAVARDKRGAHLALSLERLEGLTAVRPQRIGLSATQDPIEEVARFLIGTAQVARDGSPRCAVVDLGRKRPLDLAIEIPKDELSSVATAELWAETYDRLAELIQDGEHRTTLIFVNTRRLVERVSHALAERIGPEQVAAHHGSLSRPRRLEAEQRLKQGTLRGMVATASLELGIDVGTVDLVCQLGSPRSLSVALQRIGRAGHWRGAIPKARLFPMSRDDLLECAALVRGVRAGRLERTVVPRHPLDVLAQQIVAEVVVAPQEEELLFRRFRRAWPYHDLERTDFDALVSMLSEGVATRRGRSGALLHRDAVHGRVKGRRGARLAALTGGGAIPDSSQYAVVTDTDGVTIGQVDEEFVVESLAGDVFLLGNNSWRIWRIETSQIRVEDAHGAAPGLPFWRGEAPGRSRELSEELSTLREELERRLPERDQAVRWLAAECSLPEAGARQVIDYLAASRAVLGVIPTQRTLVAERFFDEAGGMQLVIHAPFGTRLNRAFGLALRERMGSAFDCELQAAATNDGILLSLGAQHGFPLENVFSLISSQEVGELLTTCALRSPMFLVRWRWDATRALALPRMLGGRKIPPPIARMRAEDLLAAVFPLAVAAHENGALLHPCPVELPHHPLVRETLRDCLTEAMDLEGMVELLGRMERGELRLVTADTAEPSLMSHEIVGAQPWAFLDDAPMQERRARAVALRRALPAEEASQVGALDPEAIREVEEQVWPDVRDADELHDALLDLGYLPAREGSGWTHFMDSLVAQQRAARGASSMGELWVAAERVGLYRCLVEGATLQPNLSPLGAEQLPGNREAAVNELLRGWMARLGPTSRQALANRLGLPEGALEPALVNLESQGLILRGNFIPGTPASKEAPHWCERSVLARIHRLTLGRLRREIEPTTPADFVRFLLRWQHVAPGTRLHGPRGLAEVVGQLQGFHAAAGAWEQEILPARIAGYEPGLLDSLCLSGEVAWGRLAREGAGADEEPRRRNAPTRNAPVTLVLRNDLPWLLNATGGAAPPLGPSAQALVDVLARHGACFLPDLAALTNRLPTEVEQALWELVSAGVVTCDGFAGLRTLIEPAPRHRARRAGWVGGRWALLRLQEQEQSSTSLEQLAGQYLRRYGVMLRELLARESGAPPWRELLRIFRQQEARGAIRGGRFVQGFSGEQFALPEAVEALRAVRRTTGQKERLLLSATDPLNVIGILTPGGRVAASLGNRVAYVDGVPVLEHHY